MLIHLILIQIHSMTLKIIKYIDLLKAIRLVDIEPIPFWKTSEFRYFHYEPILGMWRHRILTTMKFQPITARQATFSVLASANQNTLKTILPFQLRARG